MANSDWDTYKRLLSYLAPYWFWFGISVLGFLLAAGAEGYFVRLFGNLIDEWDNEVARCCDDSTVDGGCSRAACRWYSHR